MPTGSSSLILFVSLAIGLVLVSISLLTLFLPMAQVGPSCMHCGYSLSGSTDRQGACPECGTPVSALDWAPKATWRTRWWSLSPVLSMVSGLFFLSIAVTSVGLIHSSIQRDVVLITQVRDPSFSRVGRIRVSWNDVTLQTQVPFSKVFYIQRSIRSIPRVDIPQDHSGTSPVPVQFPIDPQALPAPYDTKALESHIRQKLQGEKDAVIQQVIADVQTMYSGAPLSAFKSVLPANYLVTHKVSTISGSGAGAPQWSNLGMLSFLAIPPIGLLVWLLAVIKRKMTICRIELELSRDLAQKATRQANSIS